MSNDTFLIEQDIKKLKRREKVSDTDISALAKQQKAYKDKTVSRPYLLEGFKNTADFTPSNATLTQDTTNFKTGTSALAVNTTTAGATTSITKTISWDLSNASNFEIKIYVPDPAQLSQFIFYFTNAGGGQFYKVKNTFIKGWNTYRFSKSEFTIFGTISWTDIMTSLLIKFYTTVGTTPTITVDSLKKDVKETPQVIFVMDDGYSSAYTVGLPYLESKGVRGCCAVYKNVLNTAGYMTNAQIKEKYDYGHDILNHSSTHPNLTSYSYNSTAKEIQDMREYLYNLGVVKGLDIFIYPIWFSEIAKQVIKDTGFTLGRGGTEGDNYGIDDLLNIRSVSLNDVSVFSSVTSKIDRIIANGGTLCFYVHDIMDVPIANMTSTSIFKQTVDYAVSSGVKITTLTKWSDDLFK